MYDDYMLLAEDRLPNFTFFGRLGSYQYLNVDQACAQAMKVANNYLDTNHVDL
jgi:UDP-galactopyranose mutase